MKSAAASSEKNRFTATLWMHLIRYQEVISWSASKRNKVGLQLSFLAWKFFLMQDRSHLFYRATCKGKVSSFPFRRLYKQASLANLFRKEMKKKTHIGEYVQNRSRVCKEVPRLYPRLTYLAHFLQPVYPNQDCHLSKVTSSSDSRTKITLYCVVLSAIATCPAVSTPLSRETDRSERSKACQVLSFILAMPSRAL